MTESSKKQTYAPSQGKTSNAAAELIANHIQLVRKGDSPDLSENICKFKTNNKNKEEQFVSALFTAVFIEKVISTNKVRTPP